MVTVGVDSNASFNHDGTISTHGVLGSNPLMQYTGLNDKSGKEIYEGDIVRHKFKRIWQTQEHTSKVVWNEFYCCYYLFDGVSNHRMRDDILYEVIGNIYENPNLLSQSIQPLIS